jgi:hypothetical protein
MSSLPDSGGATATAVERTYKLGPRLKLHLLFMWPVAVPKLKALNLERSNPRVWPNDMVIKNIYIIWSLMWENYIQES